MNLDPCLIDTTLDTPAVAVVTGATGGIGRWIALGLVRAGFHTVIVCRDRARGEATRAWIAEHDPSAATEVALADLSLVSEAREGGRRIAALHPRIGLLVNNAGVFEAQQITTSEGHDRVLATNLLAPFVLTDALLPALKAGTPSRVVNVGSSRADRARVDPRQLALGKQWTMTRAYDQSKLALMMVTFELARRLAGTGVTANVVHPGLVATGLVRAGGIIGLAWRGLSHFALSEELGAETPLYAALSPELATVTGAYFKERQAVQPNPQALDPVAMALAWEEGGASGSSTACRHIQLNADAARSRCRASHTWPLQLRPLGPDGASIPKTGPLGANRRELCNARIVGSRLD